MAVTQKNQKEPSKSLAIRRQWISSFNRRFKKLQIAISEYLESHIIVANIEQIPKDTVAVGQFLKWLEEKVDEIVFGGLDRGVPWYKIYIDRAYLQGIKTARAQLKRAGVKDITTFLEDLVPADIAGTAIPFLTGFGPSVISLFDQPIHLDAIQLLYTRSFTELKGVTQAMSQQIARELVRGVETGAPFKTTARLINDRVAKVGLSRAKLVTRTETIRAFNQGVINEGREMEGRLNVTVMYRWFTALDERVRATHKTRHGVLYTAEQAMSLIGEPNCRCAVSAVLENAKKT